jgi:hypothetical protein
MSTQYSKFEAEFNLMTNENFHHSITINVLSRWPTWPRRSASPRTCGGCPTVPCLRRLPPAARNSSAPRCCSRSTPSTDSPAHAPSSPSWRVYPGGTDLRHPYPTIPAARGDHDSARGGARTTSPASGTCNRRWCWSRAACEAADAGSRDYRRKSPGRPRCWTRARSRRSHLPSHQLAESAIRIGRRMGTYRGSLDPQKCGPRGYE